MARLAKLELTEGLTDQMSGLTGGAVSRVSAGTYIDSDGVLQTAWGNRDQLIPTNAQADTDNWDGSGPWTLTVAVTADTSYVLSVHLNGPTVSVAEDTATLDTTGAATYGSELVFTCTATGDITITTDTADPMVMLEALPSGNQIGDDLFDQETLGSELIVESYDRDFSQGQGNWALVGGPGTEVTWDNISMNFALTSFQGVRYSVTLTEGDIYKFQFDITAYTSGSLYIYIGATYNYVTMPTPGIKTFTVYGIAEDANFVQFGSSTFNGSIDNCSLKKVLSPPKGILTWDAWPSLAGSEAITAQNDRDFSSGTIGNWIASTDGSGTCAYDTTDIGGADDKQALLTSDADNYLFGQLTTAAMSISMNTLYRICAKIYVPAANSVKSVIIKPSTGLSDAIANAGAQTISGDTWTEVVRYIYVGSDITGSFQIGFGSNPADGDLIYFDDISIRPVQFSWAPAGGSTNILEIDESANALLVTYVDGANGAVLTLNDSKDLSSDLTIGETYLLQFDAKVGSGDTIQAAVNDGVSAAANTGSIAESFATYKLIFVAQHATGCYLYFSNMGAGEVVYIRNLTIKAVPDAALLEPSDYVNSDTIPAMARYESGGLLVEGEATRLSLYPRDFTNAVWAKTNITATKDQTGLDGVANSASKLAATAANGTIFQTVPTVQASGAHTSAFWVKRITGSGAVYISDDNGSNYTEITLTTSWQRFEIGRTQTQPIIGFKIAISGDAIAVDFGQVEHTSYPTSAIPGSASQVTRTSESADGTYGYMWAIAAAVQAALADTGTMIVEWTPKFSAADGSGDICILTFEPSATGLLYYDFDNTDFEASDSTNIVTVDKSIVSGTTYTLVVRWHKANDALVISVKAGGSWTHGTAGAFDDSIPHTGDKLYLHYGNEYPANFKNLYLFDRYLTDAEVEAEAWLEAQGLLSAALTSAKPSMAFSAR